MSVRPRPRPRFPLEQPCSFETECEAKHERDDEKQIAAYVHGLCTGAALLDAYHLAAPN